MQEGQLDELYDWVDSFSLSRPKKNISRDFSDAVLMAELISMNFPKLVELHNYPPGNSLRSKVSNWTTLNTKVLGKIGIAISQEDIRRLSNSTPMAVQGLLLEVKAVVDEVSKEKSNQEAAFPSPFRGERGKERSNGQLQGKKVAASKVEQLRQVLALIKEKIGIVQHSIDRKDAHIRQLEETLRMYSS